MNGKCSLPRVFVQIIVLAAILAANLVPVFACHPVVGGDCEKAWAQAVGAEGQMKVWIDDVLVFDDHVSDGWSKEWTEADGYDFCTEHTIRAKFYGIEETAKFGGPHCCPIYPSCDLLSLDKTSGQYPLTVNATINGSNATEAEIDWGEGSGWEAAPDFVSSHTYKSVGVYQVKARIKGLDGKWYESTACSGKVTVDYPCSSCDLLSLDKTEGDAPLTVNATIHSSNADMAQIDWGEGGGWELVVGWETSHTFFDKPGYYTVKARVHGLDGKWYESAACTGQVKVKIKVAPDYSVESLCRADGKGMVQILNRGPGSINAKVTWPDKVEILEIAERTNKVSVGNDVLYEEIEVVVKITFSGRTKELTINIGPCAELGYCNAQTLRVTRTDGSTPSELPADGMNLRIYAEASGNVQNQAQLVNYHGANRVEAELTVYRKEDGTAYVNFVHKVKPDVYYDIQFLDLEGNWTRGCPFTFSKNPVHPNFEIWVQFLGDFGYQGDPYGSFGGGQNQMGTVATEANGWVDLLTKEGDKWIPAQGVAKFTASSAWKLVSQQDQKKKELQISVGVSDTQLTYSLSRFGWGSEFAGLFEYDIMIVAPDTGYITRTLAVRHRLDWKDATETWGRDEAWDTITLLIYANDYSPSDDPRTLNSDGSYTVRPGDTLTQIANEFGTTVNELVKANGIENPDRIEVNQLLIIPGRTMLQDGGPLGTLHSWESDAEMFG